jgi:competence protein ComFC
LKFFSSTTLYATLLGQDALVTFFERLKDFVYPPSCILCGIYLGGELEKLCCKQCLKELELIDVKERCKRCFGWSTEGELCPSCFDHPPVFHRLGAAFRYEGSAAGLIRHLKYGGRPYLAKSLGAYMAVQLMQLEWEPFDALVPVPMTRLRKILRGYNQSELLANELAQYGLGTVVNCLKRREVGLPQASLSALERRELDPHNFFCVHPDAVQGKLVCLIDDVYTTGTTLAACAEALINAGATSVSGFTVCSV